MPKRNEKILFYFLCILTTILLSIIVSELYIRFRLDQLSTKITKITTIVTRIDNGLINE